MAPEENGTCEPCKTFGQKCSHVVKKQRAKFYILRHVSLLARPEPRPQRL
ncbi:unnamed protein product, partial [Arabidopsis halleri]